MRVVFYQPRGVNKRYKKARNLLIGHCIHNSLVINKDYMIRYETPVPSPKTETTTRMLIPVTSTDGFSYNVFVNQPDTQCFMIEFIHNIWWLDMFRTSMFHPQERLQAVCCEFGMW